MSAASRVILPACAALLACGPARSAPAGALVRGQDVVSDAMGGWMVAHLTDARTAEGELIAASADSMFILQPTGLRALGIDSLVSARLELFDSGRGDLKAWVGLGSVLTFTNGFFLVFTLPTWLSVGAFTVNRASHQPVFEWTRGQPPTLLAPFSRFPGGIPPSIDRRSLRLRSGIRAR